MIVKIDKIKEVGKKGVRKFEEVSEKATDRFEKTSEEISKEFRRHAVTAIIAGFGFIVALVWRDAIQETVNKIVQIAGFTQDTYIFRIVSALFVTLVSVVGIILITRWSGRKSAEEKEREGKAGSKEVKLLLEEEVK